MPMIKKVEELTEFVTATIKGSISSHFFISYQCSQL